MADKKAKKPLYQTPAGVAIWPWLNKYDDRPIKGKPQTPAFKLNIQYDATNPAWLALKEKLDALVEESYAKAVEENPKKKKQINRQYPYAMDLDDEGEETGKVTLKLKQNAFITDKETKKKTLVRVAKFDAKGAMLKNSLEMVQDENTGEITGTKGKVVIYGGSIVKGSFTTRPYLVDSSNGAGISLDLKAVQVLQLVSAQARSASSYGFGVEEGYEGQDEGDDAAEETTTSGDDASDPTDF